MTKTNDKLDEILKEIIMPLVGLRCRNVYQVDKLEPDDRCETCDTYERLDIAKQAIEAYIKEREKAARIDAIKSYEKVNKLLENEIRIDELKVIAQDGFDDMHGTYDYDRIAETVLDRLAELNGGSEDA